MTCATSSVNANVPQLVTTVTVYVRCGSSRRWGADRCPLGFGAGRGPCGTRTTRRGRRRVLDAAELLADSEWCWSTRCGWRCYRSRTQRRPGRASDGGTVTDDQARRTHRTSKPDRFVIGSGCSSGRRSSSCHRRCGRRRRTGRDADRLEPPPGWSRCSGGPPGGTAVAARI